MGIIKEFKDFAAKGNVVDMAVGVIVGGAFGKLVSSVTSDLDIHFTPAVRVLERESQRALAGGTVS